MGNWKKRLLHLQTPRVLKKSVVKKNILEIVCLTSFLTHSGVRLTWDQDTEEDISLETGPSQENSPLLDFLAAFSNDAKCESCPLFIFYELYKTLMCTLVSHRITHIYETAI